MDTEKASQLSVPPWQSLTEIQDSIEQSPQYEAILDAYALGELLSYGLPVSNYTANADWAKAVVLNEHGKQCLEMAQPELAGINQADILQAIFSILAHRELLVDIEKTNLQIIRTLIESDILAQRIRLPQRFGRFLYDRYNDTLEDNSPEVEHLIPEDADRLIANTSIGIYQIGRVLFGPLGVLFSDEKRFMPPTRFLPLWHCPDTGCQAVHAVELLPHETGVIRAMREIPHIASKRIGPASEWAAALSLQSSYGRRPRTNKQYADIGIFLAEQILGSERKTLVLRLLAGPAAKRIRDILSSPPRKKAAGLGSPDEVCARLSEPEMLQLLLVLSDTDLARLLDSAVWNKDIAVPVTEVRRAVTVRGRHPTDAICELSNLGLRSSIDEPVSVLSTIVLAAYGELKLEHDLSWRLREFSGLQQTGALFEHTRRHGPIETITELVLANRGVAEHVCRKLNLPIEVLSKLTNSQSAELIAWKMGFDMPRHDDSQQRFLRRLTQFNEQILAIGVIRTEDDRERARSAGVNPFVSLERLLEGLVAFNIWLLASDHFMQTHLTYDPTEALTLVAKVLGSSLESAGQTLTWRTEGQNTLGVTLRYMDEMVTWVNALPTRDRASVERPTGDIPHYAARPYIEFPFRHTELWADSDASVLAQYSGELTTVCRLISQSQPAGIRNALDHDRKDAEFPSAESLLACAARLREAAERADVLRLTARPFWLRQIRQDNSGIIENSFQDYAGRTVSVYEPTGIRPEIVYDFVHPVVIAPFNFIGRPNSILCFRMREDSTSARYWRNFPRRRPQKAVAEAKDPPVASGDSATQPSE